MSRTVKKSSIIVNSEGIRFGEFAFISHDAILRDRGPMIDKKYRDWLVEVRSHEVGYKNVVALNVDRALTPDLKTR